MYTQQLEPLGLKIGQDEEFRTDFHPLKTSYQVNLKNTQTRIHYRHAGVNNHKGNYGAGTDVI